METGSCSEYNGEATAAARRDRIDKLSAIGLVVKRRILNAYSDQLSSGVGQRVMLAMMLINGPQLLIADEQTQASTTK